MCSWSHLVILVAALGVLQGAVKEGVGSDPPPGISSHSPLKAILGPVKPGEESMTIQKENNVLENEFLDQEPAAQKKNDHTITVEDFKKKTSMASSNNQNQSINTEDLGSNSITNVIEKSAKETGGVLEDSPSLTDKLEQTPNIEKHQQGKIGDLGTDERPESENSISEDPIEEHAWKQESDFNELASQISDEVKNFSNAVVMAWSKKKEMISWTAEARSVLQDYMDKISIAQAANNSACVQNDLKKHSERTQALQSVISSCESELKWSDLDHLQNRTVDLLKQINIIVQKATSYIDKLEKEDAEYKTAKATIENDALNDLKNLYPQVVRDELSALKDRTLQGEEERYNECVSSKPEKGMIEDTLNDIMRIKNNCVG